MAPVAAARRRPSLLTSAVALLGAAVALRSALTLSFVAPAGLSQRGAIFATAARGSALRAPRVARGSGGDGEALKQGDAVEAVFADDGNWYPGTLEKDNGDGTWEVKWDNPDGGPETSTVKLDEIKKYVPPIPLDELQVGQKYTGTVVSTAPFGAFVNFGAERDGLVHVSCIKEGFVSNIDDEVQSGQEVTVWLKGIQDGKISLTMVESKLSSGGGGSRRPQADLSAFQGLGWGDKLKGTVAGITKFGAFVSVVPPSGGNPAQGLVHVSEMSDGFVEDPNSIVSVGQEVEVVVKDVDLNTQRLSLSMKTNA